MTTDPMAPLRKLLERLREQTEPMGLRIVGSAFAPGDNLGMGPDHLQIVFEIQADEIGEISEKVKEAEELLKFRKEIEAMDAERNEAAAREKLEKLIQKGGGGFLKPQEEEQA